MSATATPAPAPDRAALLARGLFAYSDGVDPTPIVADQFEIQGRLADACPGGDIAALDALLVEMTGGPAPAGGPAPPPPTQGQVVRAGLKLAPIVRAGFAVPPLDPAGRGLSVVELLTLLNDFLDALDGGDDGDDDDAGPAGDGADQDGGDLHADHPGGPAGGA